MKNELVIIGSGGFGREVLWLLQEINLAKSHREEDYKIKGFISSSEASSIKGIPILGDDNWAVNHLDRKVGIVIAIGNVKIRRKVSHFYREKGFQFPNFIHPSAIIGPSVRMGEGNLITAGAVLTTDIIVGNFVIINLNSTVGHDVIIGDCTTISPGVHISGAVNIHSDCEIGSGAVLLPGVSMGSKAILGAGAVATQNLSSETTYVGVPAKPVFGKLL